MAIKTYLFWLVLMTSTTVIHAQIVLPPKPPKPTIEERKGAQRTRLEAFPLESIPAEGWYFETGVGAAIWGSDSQCRCNALTADVGFHHVNNRGFLIGSNLLLTNTLSSTVSPTLKLGYQAIRRHDNSLGKWSANLLLGPSISNFNRGQFIRSDKYTGYIYGGELDFQPRLGRYAQLRGFIALGWLTNREKITQDGWNGPTTIRLKHSGFRIRFGLII